MTFFGLCWFFFKWGSIKQKFVVFLLSGVFSFCFLLLMDTFRKNHTLVMQMSLWLKKSYWSKRNKRDWKKKELKKWVRNFSYLFLVFQEIVRMNVISTANLLYQKWYFREILPKNNHLSNSFRGFYHFKSSKKMKTLTW